MANVQFKSVTKVFGKDVKAVDNLNLTIQDGEFMVLVGPSGCGKTTALRMIAGFEEATEGELKIGERVVNDVPPKDRDIAMVFQNYALYPHFTVYENIAFGLKLRELGSFWWQLTHMAEAKTRKEDIDRRVREQAAKLGLSDFLHRKPKELSGGQRQRVALGRAIVRKPQVFLMDEPLSNLDAKLRIQTREELIKLHRELKTTTIYVTHDQVEAMTMGQRIAVMNYGVLQQCATPDEVYNRPSNQFVAGFIGSPPMNFISGELTGTESDVRFVSGTFSIPILHNAGAKGHIGKRVNLGIRPESIFDAARKGSVDATPQNTFEVTVDVLEPLGHQIIASLNVGEHKLRAALESGSKVAEGATAQIAIALDQLHLFDENTGEAIR